MVSFIVVLLMFVLPMLTKSNSIFFTTNKKIEMFFLQIYQVVEIKEKRRFLGIKNKCNTQYHILTCRILSVT
jgi:hypothetical protein